MDNPFQTSYNRNLETPHTIPMNIPIPKTDSGTYTASNPIIVSSDSTSTSQQHKRLCPTLDNTQENWQPKSKSKP